MEKNKYGITSNVLKIIAVLFMILDHIAEYLYPYIYPNVYYILRSIGRMAMPIFVYLLVQGFFYTKNLKRYILRIFILAFITQFLIFALGCVNKTFYTNYTISVNQYLNVIFSYGFSLMLLSVIDRRKMFSNLNNSLNLLLDLIVLIFVVFIYLNLNIEFKMQVPVLFIEIYLIEKIFIDSKNNLLLKNNNKLNVKYKIIYMSFILVSIFISMFLVDYEIGNKYVILLSIIPIFLYNGNRGKNSKTIQFTFYYFYPIHQFVLYVIAMSLSK